MRQSNCVFYSIHQAADTSMSRVCTKIERREEKRREEKRVDKIDGREREHEMGVGWGKAASHCVVRGARWQT